MAKGLDNKYNFNITCKKCNSSNITADEEDGYIYLICLDCIKKEKELEKIQKLKEDKNENNDFIKEMVLANSNDNLKELLIKVKKDSLKALNIYSNIANILVEDYNKDNKNGGLVYENSSFKNEIFSMCKKFTELYIIDSIYVGIYHKNISLITYKEPILNNKFNCYELNCYAYDLSIEEDFKVIIDDTFNSPSDTIFMSNEIVSMIEILKENISKLENLINSI